MPEDSKWECEHVSHTQYECGHCKKGTGSSLGWSNKKNKTRLIAICAGCDKPTYFDGDFQYPFAPIGRTMWHLPANIAELYSEARICLSNHAHTASSMLCRKLLWELAVHLGAKKKCNFQQAVDFISSEGYIAPKSKPVIDHIRDVGNEANHEAGAVERTDAMRAFYFLESLLVEVFEHPAELAKAPVRN